MSADTVLSRVADIAEVVRSDAIEADRARRLGDKTVRALVDAGLHRMLLPSDLGGGGLQWVEAFPVIEALSRIDGATGWNTSIWAQTPTLALTLADESARDEVLADDALCAASLNWFNLRARRVDGGYVFDGRATFLSGSSHARWLSLGGWLVDDAGKPQLEDGAPAVIRSIVPMASVPVEDTWHVSGLRATASNDAAIDGLFVPDGFVSDVAQGRALAWLSADPSNHVPLQSRFGAPFAYVGLGVAMGALDALFDVAADRVALGSSASLRERADVQLDVARARALVESGRAFVDQTWAGVLGKVDRGERVSVEDQALLRLSYVTAAENAATATDLVRRTAGSAGIYESDRIERCWRDAHVVPAHAMVSPRAYERIGRVLLGLEPGSGLL
ncbi:MAG: indole-3-acetate monooxygenase [Actinomycetota bacterium]|jgi:alkylation response protein AidB-like acyl-CoA dehydrogenase|nr:indole-3-acetate monooxygenase [Actinomycetota bacterium]